MPVLCFLLFLSRSTYTVTAPVPKAQNNSTRVKKIAPPTDKPTVVDVTPVTVNTFLNDHTLSLCPIYDKILYSKVLKFIILHVLPTLDSFLFSEKPEYEEGNQIIINMYYKV